MWDGIRWSIHQPAKTQKNRLPICAQPQHDLAPTENGPLPYKYVKHCSRFTNHGSNRNNPKNPENPIIRLARDCPRKAVVGSQA